MWMLAQNVVTRASAVLSQLVLAALLRPEDFGIISLTYAVTTVIAALANVGIDDVILQRERGLRLWTEPAFWISLFLGLASGILVILVSPVAASVYKAPDLVGLLAILALSMPIGALSSVPGMIMRARMQFGIMAVYGTIETIAQAILTVALAWYDFGAYSFVIPVPIMAAVRVVVWWRLAEFRTTYRPQRNRWKYVVRNTTAVFVTKIFITLMGQGSYVILGLFATQASVGVFYFGFRLAAQPLWALAGNLSGVLFPALVQLKSDPDRQGRAALQASTLLSYCVMPLALIQAAVAEPLISRFFGDRWIASIPIIQLLSVGLALDAVSWIAGILLSARGEFIAGLRYVSFMLPVFFVFVAIGAAVDQEFGVAFAICLYYAITQPIYVQRVFQRVGVSVRQVAMVYLRPMFYAALAVGAGVVLSKSPGLGGYPIVRTAIIGAVASLLYAALVRWLAPEIWADLRTRFTSALSRKAAR